jgi:hypothetical protein
MIQSFDNYDMLLEVARQRAVAKGRKFLFGIWALQGWESKAHEIDGRDPIFEMVDHNGIVDDGIHYVLDRFTDVGTPAAKTWYAGLINNSGFTGLADADTHASHTGWTESTDYSEGARQTLSFSAAATRSISDSVSFSINGTVTIEGLFVADNSTKGSVAAATLFSTAQFSSAPSLVSGNTLTANYTLSD